MFCSLLVEFFNNTLPGCWWNLFVIFIFDWLLNYYIFFICIIFYWFVTPLLDFVIQLFWYYVGFLLVVFVFAHFLYHIFFFQWVMDIYFVFEVYFFLNPLAVFIFRFIIILIFITTGNWISRDPLKVWVTINNLRCLLCCSHLLCKIYDCVGDG